MTYTIPTYNLRDFEERLAIFKKKFAKFGNGEVSYRVLNTYTKKHTYEDGYTAKIEVVDIDVDGEYCVDGYDFVAVLDYVSETKANIIKMNPNYDSIPTTYFTRCTCDHCNSNRQRVHTFLLKNVETGEYKQVGKSCLKDFNGVNIGNYAQYLGYIQEINECGNEYFEHVRHMPTVKQILQQASAYVKKDGFYISKTYALDHDVDSTARKVYCAIKKVIGISGEFIHRPLPITEEIDAEVDAIYDFVTSNTDDSVYMHNLRTALATEYATDDMIGFVASAVSVYHKHINDINKSIAPKSEYLSEVGKKITFTATPTLVCTFENGFGYNAVTNIYQFIVNNKDIIVWKTSKYLDIVETTFTATVKEHSEYRGDKQTVITRAKAIA